jgi:hypothetical protein
MTTTNECHKMKILSNTIPAMKNTCIHLLVILSGTLMYSPRLEAQPMVPVSVLDNLLRSDPANPGDVPLIESLDTNYPRLLNTSTDQQDWKTLLEQMRQPSLEKLQRPIPEDGSTNRAPIVDAGQDQEIAISTESKRKVALVNLNGTASDPEGQPLNIEWSLRAGPALLRFADRRTLSTQVELPAAGIYTIDLTASDGEKNASSSVSILVIDQAAKVPVKQDHEESDPDARKTKPTDASELPDPRETPSDQNRPLIPVSQRPIEGGRKPIQVKERLNGIFQYIGVVTMKAEGANFAWGTGTLIGPRHVITSGTVCKQLADLRKDGAGVASFILADGRSSEIQKIEIDAGYKLGPALDMAIFTIKEPLGRSGHAEWEHFDEKMFGNVMHVTGYDIDFAQVGQGDRIVPVLVDRQGVIERCRQNQVRIGAPLFYLGVRNVYDGISFNDGMWTGAGVTMAAVGIATGMALDHFGWQSSITASPGSHGAPLWIDRNGKQAVVGVFGGWTIAGHLPGHNLDVIRKGGGLAGSTITEGMKMVPDFISKNP